MQVDLNENGSALRDAYNSVRNGNSLNWALFTYGGKGKENVLTVAGTGEGGPKELQEEFNDGKIMYAFLRVIDDNTNLPKFVLVVWVGEGVPENRKGSVTNHLNDVKKLLAGFHVQINARNEKDVEPALIQQKVRDASGAKFSVQQKPDAKPQPVEKPAPVGSNYQKPEIIGRQNTYNPPASDPNPPPASRPAPAPARSGPPPTVARAAPAAAAPPPAAPRAAAPPPAAPRAAASQPAVPRAAPAPPAVDNSARLERERQEREERERREREEQERREREEQERREREEQERREREEQERREREAAHSKPEASSTGLTARVVYDYEPVEANELALVFNDTITNIEQIDEGWWQGYNSQGQFGLFPSSYVQLVESQPADSAYQPPVVEAYAPPEAVPAAGGLQARTVYDYQATDDNEISFDVGEIVTEIEQIDEGWWRGRNQAGQFGLFPANYVELV